MALFHRRRAARAAGCCCYGCSRRCLRRAQRLSRHCSMGGERLALLAAAWLCADRWFSRAPRGRRWRRGCTPCAPSTCPSSSASWGETGDPFSAAGCFPKLVWGTWGLIPSLLGGGRFRHLLSHLLSGVVWATPHALMQGGHGAGAHLSRAAAAGGAGLGLAAGHPRRRLHADADAGGAAARQQPPPVRLSAPPRLSSSPSPPRFRHLPATPTTAALSFSMRCAPQASDHR